MKTYTPPPPPDKDHEWHGRVKWPRFSARRRGHLLEVRVRELEQRLAWTEAQLLNVVMLQAEGER